MQPIKQHNKGKSDRSRGSHRRQNFWLRCELWIKSHLQLLFRVLLILCVLAVIGYIYYTNTLVQSVKNYGQNAYQSLIERDEYQINKIALNDVSPQLENEIWQVLDLELPQSVLTLDRRAIAARLKTLAAVRTLQINMLADGTLIVNVQEIPSAFIWRNGEGLQLIARTGDILRPMTDLANYPDLPILAGIGANMALEEAQELYDALAPLKDQTRGLAYISQRRWDVVLDEGTRILLPEDRPVIALQKFLLRLHNQALLQPHVSHIDLRNPKRLTLRLKQKTAQELGDG